MKVNDDKLIAAKLTLTPQAASLFLVCKVRYNWARVMISEPVLFRLLISTNLESHSQFENLSDSLPTYEVFLHSSQQLKQKNLCE